MVPVGRCWRYGLPVQLGVRRPRISIVVVENLCVHDHCSQLSFPADPHKYLMHPLGQHAQIASRRQRYAFVVGLLAFLLLNMQTVSATGHIVDEAGPAIKLYHLYFLLLVGWILMRGRLVRWRAEVVIYFLIVVLSGGAAYFAFGVRLMLINYLFAAYVVVIGSITGHELGPERSLRLLRIGAGAILIAVLVKAIVFADVLVSFILMPNAHPDLPFIYGGGANLEASWIALGAALFIGTRLFYPYCLASLAIGVLYASRGSIVFLALIVGLAWLRHWNQMHMTRALRLGIIGGMGLLSVGVVVGVTSTLENATGVGYVIQRFSSIGHEPGSLGRITLWTGGVRVFQNHPFGVGQGNAIEELEHELDASVPEDNLHNVFLQHLVDTGMQGFLAYALFCIVTFARIFRDRFRNPLLLYAGVYLVAGAIQFRGVDAIFWFIYALDMGAVAGAYGGASDGAVDHL